MSVLAGVDTEQVTAIASEVLAAMIDRSTGLLTAWPGGPMAVDDPLHAWVDLSTVPVSRLQLTTDAGTAGDLTRSLLAMGETAPVSEADVKDALGEIANILAGNVKSLLRST